MASPAALESPAPQSALDGYGPGNFYCGLLGTSKQPGRPRAPLWHALATSEPPVLMHRATDVERELFNLGITFSVCTKKDSIDCIQPFDVINASCRPPTGRRSGRA